MLDGTFLVERYKLKSSKEEINQAKEKLPKVMSDYIDEVFSEETIIGNDIIRFVDLIINVTVGENCKIYPQKIIDCIDFVEETFFNLVPVQKFIIGAIMGFYNTEYQTPMFNQIFYMSGRGSGKTAIASAMSLYLLSELNGVDPDTYGSAGIKDYDIDCIAVTENQAKMIFDDIYNYIVSLGTELSKRIFKFNKTEITYRLSNSTIRYRTSNPKSADSRRAGAIIFDEVHGYENYENLRVNTSGLGKIPEPRRFYMTSEGHLRGGVIDDFKDRADRILSGENHEGFLPIMFRLDDVKEVNNQNAWVKANPLLEINKSLLAEMRSQYVEMLGNSQMREEFIVKRMGLVYNDQADSVATWEDIIATKDHEWIDLTNHMAVGGVDYADLRDFASVGLRWKVDGMTYFTQHTFVHETSLELTKYNIDIKECVDKGDMTIVPNSQYATIPPHWVANWFYEQGKKYAISHVQGDSFRISALRDEFNKIGLELREVRNGYITHSKLAPEVLNMFSNRKIALDDSKLMRWYINNVELVTDKKGNKTFLKKDPVKRKTDGFFALLHSMVGQEQEAQTLNLDLPFIQF